MTEQAMQFYGQLASLRMGADLSFPWASWVRPEKHIYLLTISRLADTPIVISMKVAVRLFRAHDSRPPNPLRHRECAARHKKASQAFLLVACKTIVLCCSSLKAALRHIRETADELHGQMCCLSQLGAMVGRQHALVTKIGS
jgi:hypothetical protein